MEGRWNRFIAVRSIVVDLYNAHRHVHAHRFPMPCYDKRENKCFFLSEISLLFWLPKATGDFQLGTW